MANPIGSQANTYQGRPIGVQEHQPIFPWTYNNWQREDALRYEEWAREDIINAQKQFNADTAIQRKVHDARMAGVNPYMAMMGNATGAAQPVIASSGGTSNTAKDDTGNMIKSLIGVIATVATAGIAAKVTMSRQAKNIEAMMEKTNLIGKNQLSNQKAFFDYKQKKMANAAKKAAGPNLTKKYSKKKLDDLIKIAGTRWID